MQKKILILNGSINEIPLILEAKRMGYFVVTTGNMPQLAGHKYADQYIQEDYSNKEKILELVQKENIDEILSCANDFGVLTASFVAEKMGWHGHDTYENAKLMHHKELFKQYTLEHNIPSPVSQSFDDLGQAIAYVKDAEYPIIVKANDLTGGKGILRADNEEEAMYAVNNAFDRSRDKRIVIEPFILGTQHTIDTFIVNKKVKSFSSCNSYSLRNPYLIQAETLPADDIDLLSDELIGIIEEMAEDLDLADGILAMQYIKKDGKPYIFEMMRRPFGNQFLTLLEKNTGFPWHKAQILAETGQDCSTLNTEEPEMKYCGHHGVMAEQNGILENYHIPEEIEEHIFNKIEMLQPGDQIQDYMNERIAYIYYAYNDPEEMNCEVKKYNDLITIELSYV